MHKCIDVRLDDDQNEMLVILLIFKQTFHFLLPLNSTILANIFISSFLFFSLFALASDFSFVISCAKPKTFLLDAPKLFLTFIFFFVSFSYLIENKFLKYVQEVKCVRCATLHTHLGKEAKAWKTHKLKQKWAERRTKKRTKRNQLHTTKK